MPLFSFVMPIVENQMEEKLEFFTRSQSISTLNKFKARMDTLHATDPLEVARNSHIQTIIHAMAKRPEEWDQLCGINIDWIGNQFISRISDESEELTKGKIDDIFAMCFRFLFELYLSTKNDLATEFDRARRFAFDNLNWFDGHAKEQIEYAIRDMPINIFKSIANSDSIKNIKNFNELSVVADAKRQEWDADLTAREERVNTLKSELATYESGFNFVGLFDGFNDLSKEKNEEKRSLRGWLFFLGILIVMPLVVELVALYLNLEKLEQVKNVLALSIVPTVSLIAILIYYFRVILFNYKSVKSQLLQIELRKTLCRFIQHYADYSFKLKEKDKESLAKFENIIFSGIVSDDGSLPSTYDGVEQLGKLIKSIKGA